MYKFTKSHTPRTTTRYKSGESLDMCTIYSCIPRAALARRTLTLGCRHVITLLKLTRPRTPLQGLKALTLVKEHRGWKGGQETAPKRKLTKWEASRVSHRGYSEWQRRSDALFAPLPAPASSTTTHAVFDTESEVETPPT